MSGNCVSSSFCLKFCDGQVRAFGDEKGRDNGVSARGCLPEPDQVTSCCVVPFTTTGKLVVLEGAILYGSALYCFSSLLKFRIW